MSWKKSLSLAVVLLSGSAYPLCGQGVAGKTITVTGTEQSSGGTWDTGTATLTIVTSGGTYTKTMTGSGAWGQYSTPASIASWLAAQVSWDGASPVWALAYGTTITLVPRVPNMPFTVRGSTTYDSAHFGSASFTVGSSSSTTLDPTLVVRCTPSTIGPGQTTNCTASITGDDAALGAYVPVNPITFSINGTSWTSSVVDTDGDALAAGGLYGATAGPYTIEAHYSHSGDSHYTADMDAKTYVTVVPSDPATSTVYSYNIYKSDLTTPGFDAAGNITDYYDSTTGQWQNIQYDALNRMVRADGPSLFNGGSNYFCWTYDLYGNRTAQNLGTSAFTYSSGACSGGGTTTTDGQAYDAPTNRLTAADHPLATFSYDDAGDVTVDDAHGYAYDAEGHLCAMSTTILSITTYRGYLYDASGMRIAQGTQSSMSCDLTSNGFTMTNMYVRGAGGTTMTETDGSGTWQHTDVGAGGLVATYDVSGLHFQATDWLGTRKAQTDYAGVLEHGYQHMPFGEIVGSDGGATEKHFTGQEHDDESGNDYFNARYYASVTGRFMSPDPSGLFFADPTNPQSLNHYNYALNNPLIFSDPTGKFCYKANSDQTSVDIDNSAESADDCESGATWVPGTATSFSYGADNVLQINYASNDGSGSVGVIGFASPDVTMDSSGNFSNLWVIDPHNISKSYSIGENENLLDQNLFGNPGVPGTRWCGPGGGGPTTNADDAACKEHDRCYAAAGVTAAQNTSNAPATDAQVAAMTACNQALYNSIVQHPFLVQTPFLALWITGRVGHLRKGTEAKDPNGRVSPFPAF